ESIAIRAPNQGAADGASQQPAENQVGHNEGGNDARNAKAVLIEPLLPIAPACDVEEKHWWPQTADNGAKLCKSRLMPAPLKATCSSMSLPRSWVLTTTPSPNCGCRTWSPAFQVAWGGLNSSRGGAVATTSP